MMTHAKLGELIKECWDQEPAKRPSMSDVCARLKSDILVCRYLLKSTCALSLDAGSNGCRANLFGLVVAVSVFQLVPSSLFFFIKK
jgi:hypothetical protein